jgi:outer membrane protein assembly factor BamD (BamD/ComL family)
MRLLLVPLALSAGLSAQEGDVVERLFHSGERAYAAKSFAEALETWGQLLQQAPRSPLAAQALFRMARHQVESRNPQAALALLDRLKAEHLRSPWAGEGMLLRGVLLMQAARRPQDLREAMAEFNRVLDLFPDHPSTAEANFQLGLAWRDQGQSGRALASFLEATRLNPASPVAQKASLQAAEILDLSGDLAGCLRMLQNIRTLAPSSPEAQEAEWRIAVRVKHRISKPPLRSEGAWPGGRTKWLKTPTLLATGPGGELFIYQDDLDQAFELRGTALVPAGPQAKGARAMTIGPAGTPWLVAPKQPIHRQEGALGTQGPAAPGGAFVDRWGGLWLSDAKSPAITVLAGDGSSRQVPSPAAVTLAPTPGGGAVLASDANRSLHVLNAQGQPQLTIPYGKDLPGAFRYVLSLASDPLGHFAAIVDGGDFEGVVLWGPDGQMLRSATFKALGLSGKFRSLALDRQGGILLADRSNDLLVRLD